MGRAVILVVVLMLMGCRTSAPPPPLASPTPAYATSTPALATSSPSQPMAFEQFDAHAQAAAELMSPGLSRLTTAMTNRDMNTVEAEATALKILTEREIDWMYRVEDAGGVHACLVDAAEAWSVSIYAFDSAADNALTFVETDEGAYADLTSHWFTTAADSLRSYLRERDVSLSRC